MNLDDAIKTHAEWKMKLRSAISAQTQLDANTISKDNCCPLGQWLHGEAKAKFGQYGSYTECLRAHTIFHREAGKVAQLINQKKYTEAQEALGGGTPYNSASSDAGIAINRLKKEAAL